MWKDKRTLDSTAIALTPPAPLPVGARGAAIELDFNFFTASEALPWDNDSSCMTTESRGADSPKSEIRILSNREELSTVAAQVFVGLVEKTAEEKRFFSVALSGGSTPKGLYALLA